MTSVTKNLAKRRPRVAHPLPGNVKDKKGRRVVLGLPAADMATLCLIFAANPAATRPSWRPTAAITDLDTFRRNQPEPRDAA